LEGHDLTQIFLSFLQVLLLVPFCFLHWKKVLVQALVQAKRAVAPPAAGEDDLDETACEEAAAAGDDEAAVTGDAETSEV
jgi:hypothetical protein